MVILWKLFAESTWEWKFQFPPVFLQKFFFKLLRLTGCSSAIFTTNTIYKLLSIQNIKYEIAIMKSHNIQNNFSLVRLIISCENVIQTNLKHQRKRNKTNCKVKYIKWQHSNSCQVLTDNHFTLYVPLCKFR